MNLFAISDLHVGQPQNWQALQALPPHPNDWLIVAGDICESVSLFGKAVRLLSQRFGRVFWTPGNHDLWTLPTDPAGLRGLAKYHRLIDICREHGVLTPEDPFIRWPGSEEAPFIAPTFTLYDYSFRPDDISLEAAVEWAAESGVVCVDEAVLHPDPFPSRAAWCTVRCRYTEERLRQVADEGPIILVNHYPLRQDLVRLRFIPRFSIWCGTRQTEAWHRQYPVKTVVYGHLHIRGSHRRDGVPFEEVSLGYPRHWQQARGMDAYLRQLLPRGQ